MGTPADSTPHYVCKGIRHSILGGELKARNAVIADSRKWKATVIDNFPYHRSARIEISLREIGMTRGGWDRKESSVT